MSRPSDINTKTMSVRVPMQFYLDFLNEAIEKNLSLSDYMNYKLMTKIDDRKAEIDQLHSELGTVKTERDELKNKLAFLSDDKSKTDKKVSERVNALTEQVKKAKEVISTLRDEIKQHESDKLELGTRLEKANKFIKDNTFSSKKF